ncbi:sigma-70 family RNA polymerase sigma factor [Lusitaniella coriacea LEGE 07157]|uniref:Sigma-70 family RNA polymerase sigma factor n=1 Tax=Lusitaniella coriacea LEGE 07157 TaxID=945747 RepID=A0A8J7E1I5_9CYAN|nr:sigma-70 family RNA polymerase sigma factor [Lusitaniella coriacea]MBE9118846.1 sigma-70 family RNA polymerase sigma factor [Lusitaniella coriacea LEGE 07157]
MKTQKLRTTELLATYARTPSIEIRNQLVQLNMGLVRKVAYRISQQSCEPYEDLEQIGFIGLIRAIERFNLRKGYAFSSFAIPYIRGEMLNFLRDKGSTIKIPRRWQELYRKGKKLRKTLELSLGHPPQDCEIAIALEVSLQEWCDCKMAIKNRLLLSLDASLDRNEDKTLTLEETLADPHEQKRQYWQEERLQLQGAMSHLETKTQKAIDFVFLRDLSRKEAAKRIGVSTITIARHLQKGIERLGTELQNSAAV